MFKLNQRIYPSVTSRTCHPLRICTEWRAWFVQCRFLVLSVACPNWRRTRCLLAFRRKTTIDGLWATFAVLFCIQSVVQCFTLHLSSTHRYLLSFYARVPEKCYFCLLQTAFASFWLSVGQIVIFSAKQWISSILQDHQSYQVASPWHFRCGFDENGAVVNSLIAVKTLRNRSILETPAEVGKVALFSPTIQSWKQVQTQQVWANSYPKAFL